MRQRGGRGLSRGQLRFWQIRWGLPKRLVDGWLKRDALRFDIDPAASRSGHLVERCQMVEETVAPLLSETAPIATGK